MLENIQRIWPKILLFRFEPLILRVVFHIILSYFPGLIGVEAVHALESLKRVRPQILLVNDSIGANDERLHSGDPILGR